MLYGMEDTSIENKEFIRLVWKNNHEAVEDRLENHHQDPAAGQKNQCTPLCVAIRGKSMKMIKLLLRYTKPTKYSLHAAVYYNLALVVEILLEHGVSIEEKNDVGDTPLVDAVGAGAMETVQLLLRLGADTNVTDTSGNTLVHLAASRAPSDQRCLDIVQLFVKDRRDRFKVNVKNLAGRTPLHWAATRGHLQVTNFFLKCGADGCIKDKEGYTPLLGSLSHYYVHRVEACLETAKALIMQPDSSGSFGEATNLANLWGESPLGFVLSQRRHVKRVTKMFMMLLLEHNANPSTVYKNTVDTTHAAMPLPPLILAIKRFHPDFAILLLKHGADIDGRDERGGTVWHAWLRMIRKSPKRNKKIKFAKKLVELKADIDAIDAKGFTPLHFAALFDMNTQIEFLVKAGAGLYPRDFFGYTPREYIRSATTVSVYNEEARRRESYDISLAMESSRFARRYSEEGASGFSRIENEVLSMIIGYYRQLPPQHIPKCESESKSAELARAYLA